MTRRFTKILAALALLVFMMPSLAVWGQTKITDYSSIVSGKKYYIGATVSETDYYFYADGSSVGEGIQGTSKTDKTQASVLVFEGSGTSWSIKFFDSGNYLSLKNQKDNGKVKVVATAENWTVSNVSNLIQLKINGYLLQKNSGTSLNFGSYASGQKNVWLEEISENIVATPTFSLASGETGTTLFSDDIVELECTTENSTIYYTIGDNPEDPDDQSEEYNPNEGIEISETTTIKAIAYVGNDHSSVATKTYTFPTLITMAAAHELESNAYGLVEGVVTFIDGRNVYAQDETGGICLFLNANTVPSGLAIGDKVRAYGQRSAYNGLIELQNIDGGSNAFSIVSSGNELPLAEKTIAEVLSGGADALQSTRVKIVNATIGTINTSGNTPLTQNGSSTNIYKVPTLTDIEEGDQVNVIGVIGYYNAAQIRVASADDVELYVNTTPTITVDETALSFTYIVGGSAEAQTLAITGTNTTEAIVATVAEGDSYFSISDDEVNWSSTLQLPAAGDAIVVRLNPGLTNGTFDGTITLTSAGAQTVTVTLTGTVTNQTYAINLTQPTTGGTIAADKETAEAGQTVTLTATPATGYAFGEWTVLKDDLETEVEVNNNQFVMPNCEVLVSGTFSQANYTITVAETTNGTVECEDQTAHYGDEILVTVTPAEGYRVASFTVTENGGEGGVTDIEIADDIYSFSMPAYNVTITVVFEVIPDVYGGEGTFNKVTDLTDLEDGEYYVLTYDNHALKASYYGNTTNEMASEPITPNSNNEVIDPSTDIVWKLEKNGDNWNLYNDEIGKYCCIIGNSTTAFSLVEEATVSYTVSLSNEAFIFATTATGGRCISYYSANSSFRSYASSNATTKLTLYKLGEASQDPYITVSPDAVTVPGAGGQGTLTITYDNLSSPTFTIQYYEENQGEYQPVQQAPAWMNNVAVAATTDGYVVNYNIAKNNDADREARFKLLVGDVSSNLVTFTQSKYVAPVTYSLATNIVSGKHYIITNGTDKAMGAQGSNNRPAVDVTIENNVATVNSADVYEFVINGPDKDGFYTIYDAREPGYLFAAGSGSGKNYLRTQSPNDANGQWTITIAQNGSATIVAQGTNTNKYMRFNNTLFSCYAENSTVTALPYLYKKDNETEYTFVKDIKGYGNATNRSNWYLISSPVGSIVPSNNVENMIESNGNYDLYSYNQSEEKEWINYKQHTNDFELANGQGYLYANSNDVTLIFTGDESQQTNQYWPDVQYDANADNPGWNLIGNPYGHKATLNKGFYVMKDDGTEIIAATGTIVGPMEGVFVQISDENEEVKFTPDGVVYQEDDKFVLNLVQNRGNIVDRAIVRMGEGRQLSKFQLFENSTKIYIPQNGKDYAVVRSEGQGELPVNFRAAENGTYTLSIDTEDMEMNYLHLIDNMTGMDVDLLQTPSYTFEANVNDYESRFRLVFAGASTGSEADESFAFFSNGSLIVNNEGEATLQVIDLTGRILSSENVNGSVSTTLNAPTGVYMLRLINGDNVKVQKIVVR